MIELGFTVWQLLLIVLVLSGVISYGLTQIAKMLVTSYIKHTPKDDKEPWWWNSFLRLTAILIGGVMGGVLSLIGLNVVMSVCVGLAGGAMNTAIVSVVRSKLVTLKNSLDEPDKDDEDVK